MVRLRYTERGLSGGTRKNSCHHTWARLWNCNRYGNINKTVSKQCILYGGHHVCTVQYLKLQTCIVLQSMEWIQWKGLTVPLSVITNNIGEYGIWIHTLSVIMDPEYVRCPWIPCQRLTNHVGINGTYHSISCRWMQALNVPDSHTGEHGPWVKICRWIKSLITHLVRE